jgi:chorismate--pyruvate lyase
MSDHWKRLTTEDAPRLPSFVRDWVTLETSMTARIGVVAGTAIDVDVLQQARGPLHADERGFFDPPAAEGVVREVCLKSEGQPLLVARTVFTSRRLEEHPTIVRLGNHALGSLLFADGPPRYSARDSVTVGEGAPLWPLIRQRHDSDPGPYWARRTLFELFGEVLLVTEIFMPELLDHPGNRAG